MIKKDSLKNLTELFLRTDLNFFFHFSWKISGEFFFRKIKKAGNPERDLKIWDTEHRTKSRQFDESFFNFFLR